MKTNSIKLTLLTLLFILLTACNAAESVKDAVDSIDVSRKPIDTSKMGVNAFVNDKRFGTPSAQFSDIKNNLKLRYVRVLFNWDARVQASPSTPVFFGFMDEVIESLPPGVDAIAVLTGLPSWMKNSENWTGGDPRRTFVEEFVKPVAARYASRGKLIGYQIWNEQNADREDNKILGVYQDPTSYVDLLSLAKNAIEAVSPSKLTISGATTAINQNYPDTLNYNRAMRDANAQSVCDVWAIHYYGKQFERVTTSGGVADFLNGLTAPIWVTESGAQGVNAQLAYGETAWPFLIEQIPGIDRIYVYQYTEATAPETSYGLRTLSKEFPVSDLYVWLQSR